MGVSYYDSATWVSEELRPHSLSSSSRSICLDANAMAYVVAFLSQLVEQVAEELADSILESLENLTDCQGGASFRRTVKVIEVAQDSTLPPPPWEFRLIDKVLEFRTKENN